MTEEVERTTTPGEHKATGTDVTGSIASPDSLSPQAALPEAIIAESPVYRSWRVQFLSGLIVCAWVIILGRLIHLQGAQRTLMNDRVARQSLFSEVIPARPGEILDRSGHVLAMTVMCDSLYAVPCEIDNLWEFSWKVSSTLNLNADELYQRLQDNSDKQFLWIKRRMDESQMAAFRALNLPKASWGLRREYLRRYPQGGYASHVLGLRDIDNEGRGGLEQGLNESIRGEDGRRVMTRDARGIVMEVAAEQSRPPQHGRSVVSTIDLTIQIRTEEHLDQLMDQWKPLGACAIVMEPHSGEILAMVSRPSFRPDSLTNLDPAAWKNLAISAVFEPGSTFKPFIVGWALEHNKLGRDEMIDCSFGAYRMGPRVLHDHHSYGALSVEDVLVKSSNIGMARIAERIGLESLYEATCSFGFGRRTGIELPGELPGIVQPFKRWNIYSLGSVPMGQELAVTPLQLITAHAAIANGGKLVRPRLVRSDSEGSANLVAATVDVETPLLGPENCDWLVQHPMKGVVERGTGKSAKIPGISMFGKTGTAQKLDPDTGTYSDHAWVLSFLCGAPAENPEVLVLVMVDEPSEKGVQYGGTVAAPTAAKILQSAMERMPQLRFDRTPSATNERMTEATKGDPIR